ncbi:hypothetical protein KJ656_04625 [bacterium]|nr:hypothetical protein [bacterium]
MARPKGFQPSRIYYAPVLSEEKRRFVDMTFNCVQYVNFLLRKSIFVIVYPNMNPVGFKNTISIRHIKDEVDRHSMKFHFYAGFDL